MSMSKSWTPIAGYEGYYEIHPTGKIRSVDRRVTNFKGNPVYYPGRILIGALVGPGTKYRKVTLSKGGKEKIHAVHRLVAQTFIPQPPGKTFVLHCDGNSQNNDARNLRWGDQKENIGDMIRHGVFNYNTKNKRTPRHIVEEIKASTKTLDQLSAIYGLHQTTISRLRHKVLPPL